MSSHEPTSPLAGIRVVDLTHEWAGPHATRLLADFGAEVIKVEYSCRMDIMRLARKENQAYNYHPRWLQLHRNKCSITLDLKDSHDVEAFKSLVKIADVVVESSRPGVIAAFGLGYDALCTIKPNIILVSMSAFGQTGPESPYAGYGGSLEPVSGLQGLTAYDRSSRPTRIREMDVLNGVLGACAIMTAVVYCQQTGQGQWIDLSQLEATTSGLVGEHLLEYVMNGVQTLPMGNRHTWYAPQGCYRCKGDDKWMAISVRSDNEWGRFCDVIGQPELKRVAKFATREQRTQNHDELDHLIEAWTLKHSPNEAMHFLQQAGVAAGAVLMVEELTKNPHLEARGYFKKAQDGSNVLFPGMPFRLSEGEGEVRYRGPALGRHNQYVLCSLLGRSQDELEPLTEEKIGTAFDPE